MAYIVIHRHNIILDSRELCQKDGWPADDYALWGTFFLVDSITNADAMNIAMLVIGRMLHGFGMVSPFSPRV